MLLGAGERLRAWAAEEIAFRRPLLFAPVALGAGSLWWFTRAADPDGVLLAAVALAAVCASGFLHGRRPGLALAMAALALFCAGGLLAAAETWRAGTLLLDSPVTTTVTGRIDGREQVAGGGVRYRLTLVATDAPEIRRPPLHVALMLRGEGDLFQPGETIAGRARLSPPSGPALPGLDDFAFSAFYAGSGATGYFLGQPERVADAPPAPLAGLTDRLLAWRGRIGDHIRAAIPGDAGAFAAALVTDERRAISEKTTEALRQAGLAHIIAISGLNMALASGIFFVGLRSLMALTPALAHRLPVRRLAALGALAGVTAYYAISGFAVSAERAYLMSLLVLLAIVLGRPALNLFNLALAALAVLVLQPSALLGASFQMSFAATLALIAGYEAMTRRARPDEDGIDRLPLAFRLLRAIGLFIAGVLVTSLIGSLATGPFAIAHFHRMAVYGLLANLAAMPLISFVVMPAGLVAMLLMPLGGDPPFLLLMGLGLEGVIAIASAVAGLGGDLLLPRGEATGLAVATLGLLLLTLLRTRLRLSGLPLLALGLGLLLLPAARPTIVVGEDGTLVALVGPAGLSTNRATQSGFVLQQWQAALGTEALVAPVVAEDDPPLLSGRFACRRKSWCRARLPTGEVVATVEASDARSDASPGALPDVLADACRAADLVILSRPAPEGVTCRPARLIDARLLRRTGALALTVDDRGHWQAEPAFATLSRPWQRHRAYDWRRDLFVDERPEAGLAALFNDSGG